MAARALGVYAYVNLLSPGEAITQRKR
jgi:hypothetical protein